MECPSSSRRSKLGGGSVGRVIGFLVWSEERGGMGCILWYGIVRDLKRLFRCHLFTACSRVVMVLSFLGGAYGVRDHLLRLLFFIWTASLGRILTIDNLICRGHILVNWCSMCRGGVETVDHLFVHCSVACRLWSLIVALFGMAWVHPGSVIGVL